MTLRIACRRLEGKGCEGGVSLLNVRNGEESLWRPGECRGMMPRVMTRKPALSR